MNIEDAEAAKDPARFMVLVDVLDCAKTFSELVEELADEQYPEGYSTEDEELPETMLKHKPSFSGTYAIKPGSSELDRATKFDANYYRATNENSPLIYEIEIEYGFGNSRIFRHTYIPRTFTNSFQVLDSDGWTVIEDGQEALESFELLISHLEELRQEDRIEKVTTHKEPIKP
jgi:hypothetical protein